MASRTIETNLKLTGEKEFNQQMKALNNGLKTTKSDMAALSAEFGENAESVEALTAKQKLLESTVNQQRNKVSALNDQYEKAKEVLGENAATTQKYKQALNNAKVALTQAEKAAESNAEAVEKAEKAEKKYIPVTKRMADAIEEGKKEIEEFKAEIKETAYHTPVVGEAMDVAKASVKALGKAVNASKGALKGFGNVAESTAKGTLKIAGGAAKGIGAISAASVAGVAALGAGAVAILGKMASFAKEAADAAKAANEAGEPLTDDQKKWLAFSEQLDAVEASVQTAKTALGNVLLPVLSDLAGKGATYLTDFSKDLDAAAGDTGEQGKVIAKYIVRLAKDLMAELPEFVEVGKELIMGLGDGLRENEDVLIDGAFDLLMDLLQFIMDYAPEFATGAIELVEKLVQGLTDQGPELMQSAMDMVVRIIEGLAQAAPDLIPMAIQLVSTLLVALVAAAPDLILAGLELVFGIIQGIFNSFDDIKNAVSELIETAKEAFGEKADEFKKIGSDILKLLKQGLQDEWDAFVKWITDLWDSVFADRKVNVDIEGNDPPDPDGSHSGGLNYVPFDKDMARLHQGEMVLKKTEADAYRNNRGLGGQKIINLHFSTTTITEADVNMVIDIVNRKLGEAM